MSNALSIVSKTTGASEEEIKEVLSGMIVSAKNQHGSKATNAELAVVTGVCAKYGLNPLVKECAAFISGGKLSVVVMVDGWYKMVNRQTEFDGVEFDDHLNDKGEVTAITCKMYIKNRSRPVCITEYLNECFDVKSTVWKRWPARMLRHKAYIQAARIAFGISEIIDNDEVDRINSTSNKPAQPTIEVDYNAIDQSFAECGDDDMLLELARETRRQLEQDGAWETAKAKVAEMRLKHKNRIEAMIVEDNIEEAEFTDDFGDEEVEVEDADISFE